MNIETRLKKLEQQLKNEIGETDFSGITDEEIEILLNALDNGTYTVVDGRGISSIPEVQAIDNKIIWGNDADACNLTDNELEQEILKYR